MEENYIYDETYDIRLAEREDIPAIMDFIDKAWAKGHILSYDRRLFEYEYCDGEEVHMIIAIRREGGILEGILGFIPASYDMNHLDVWGCMWKVRDGNTTFLGVELKKRLQELYPNRTFYGVGINMSTSGTLAKKIFHQEVGYLKQWYFLGKRKEYKIAYIVEEKSRTYITNSTCNVVKIPSFTELERYLEQLRNPDIIPYKDNIYIYHRYYAHPIFHYVAYGIFVSGKIKAVMLTREVTHEQSKVLRIVDYVGGKGAIRGIGKWLSTMVKFYGYEYIDFYEYGFADEDLEAAGFVERTINDQNIIPNYFSPFVRENVEIGFYAPHLDLTICKSDGDQDRPN